jgi:hypothetical protein
MFPQNSSTSGLRQRAETQVSDSASPALITFSVDDNRLSCDRRPYSMLPKCPHCQEPLTKKQVARLLASLSAGKPKNYTDEERTLRRERMRAINARRNRSGFNTAMQHRHLTHQDFTLAAIDDVIARGQRDAWESLHAAFGRDREIRAKVLRVCAAHVADPYAQRYHFWNNYAHLQAAS